MTVLVTTFEFVDFYNLFREYISNQIFITRKYKSSDLLERHVHATVEYFPVQYIRLDTPNVPRP